MIGIKNKLDFAKEKTFFISGLGIEVMGEDIGKANYSSALQAQEEGSSEGWRLPNADTMEFKTAGNSKYQGLFLLDLSSAFQAKHGLHVQNGYSLLRNKK